MIVGLGNPGAAYQRTRHNVGFDVVEELADRHKIKINKSRKQALVAELEISGVPVALVKPLTFMNLSGRAVKALAEEFGIKPAAILVITDELDLPVGKMKMKPKGSSGGHNGHKSVIASLQSEEYPRIKIGIGKGGTTIDHVLSRFDPEERTVINQLVERSADAAEYWVSDGIERAMNFANSTD
ncbi:MAG: aminoacyl-tRNA hydrolase [Fimbriimonadaceae bacterium]|nr:MAG: aminoacyl-tRNA hydrolase [Fimbriimonadaceae bacterium]